MVAILGLLISPLLRGRSDHRSPAGRPVAHSPTSPTSPIRPRYEVRGAHDLQVFQIFGAKLDVQGARGTRGDRSLVLCGRVKGEGRWSKEGRKKHRVDRSEYTHLCGSVWYLEHAIRFHHDSSRECMQRPIWETLHGCKANECVFTAVLNILAVAVLRTPSFWGDTYDTRSLDSFSSWPKGKSADLMPVFCF